MNISGKYKNYDLHPYRKIEGYEEQAWEGMEAVSHALKESMQSLQAVQKRVVLNLALVSRGRQRGTVGAWQESGSMSLV